MSRVRRRAVAIAAVWLSCQAAALAIAPLAFASATLDGAVACTCALGDHAACPMHHQPASSRTRCVMSGATDHSTALLTSLFSVMGLLPPAAVGVAAAPRGAIVAIAATPSTVRSAVPEPPPPRS